MLAIIHATRKFPHYFQVHTMVLLTQLPLQALLRKSDYMGRIAKLGTMLRSFDIKYFPQTAVKGQVLTDFIAEFTEDVGGDERLGSRVLVASASSTAILEV